MVNSESRDPVLVLFISLPPNMAHRALSRYTRDTMYAGDRASCSFFFNYKMSYLVRSNVTYGTMMKLRYSIGSGMKVFMA